MKNVIMKGLLAGIAVLALALDVSCTMEGPRRETDFNIGWHFALTGEDASAPGFDDRSWRFIDLPHDWSIEGAFSDTNKATPGGGALPGGIGWYRKAFHMSAAERGRPAYVEFDGVYRNSEVWINGHYLGKRPYGYSSFRYELTPWLKYGPEDNIIAVKVDNSQQPNSRWYSGSGIYRNVRLVTTAPVAVDHWGTYVTSKDVTNDRATVRIETAIKNVSGSATEVTVKNTVFNAKGRAVATFGNEKLKVADTVAIVVQETEISVPHLWSVDDPYLYTIVTEVKDGSKLLDSYETTTGIRYFSFDSKKGFILNGEPVKIKGVCNHHDLGCLGTVVYPRAIERQLEILKAMGCNAIRTSHNPPAPELLDLCDRMGFIVMDEAFDMWKMPKTRFDYSNDWDEWHERDLRDMIMRDRNHPSVFMWSIGNEILEQWDSTGLKIAPELAGIVRSLDTTRPVTSACNDPQPYNNLIRSGALDLIGYNYHETWYESFPDSFPGRKFIAAETNSALATRGSYDMPADSVRVWPLRWDLPFKEGNSDLTCSSYDNCRAPWGSTQEDTWRIIRKHDFLSGMFIWTGFDYLGEPTPYWWPARSSYFGLIDLAGFPKDAYYFYQAAWTGKPVLHLLPHWNWEPGQVVDVWAYTNCDEVELFLNGKSQGRQTGGGDTLHMAWKVVFEPGTLLATGYRDGKEIMRTEVKTAGEPAAIILSPDRTMIKADGYDLSFVTVTIVDKDNNPVPRADNLVNFSIEGNATIIGVDNGCQTSMESFRENYRKAFNGKCLAVIRAGTVETGVKLTASSEGLTPATAEITVR